MTKETRTMRGKARADDINKPEKKIQLMVLELVKGKGNC